MDDSRIIDNAVKEGLMTEGGKLTAKALALIETEKGLPVRGSENKCAVCNVFTKRKCYRCQNYFCRDHINFEYDDGDILCKECDDFILTNF